jgi:DNA-binding XRE family transcriptional regulator
MSSWTSSYTDDRVVVEEARQRRMLQVRAEYLTEMRKEAGMTQAEAAEAMGVSQQCVSAIESGSVAELATLADNLTGAGLSSGYLTGSPGGPGAGDPDTAALVRGVAEGICHAGFQLRDPVQGLGPCIRHAGQDRRDDLVLPLRYCPGQREQLGDVVVLRAPVIEGAEPAADVALARRGSGDAGSQAQRVAELLLADLGRGDLLPVPIRAQGVDDLGELVWPQVLQVAHEQALDPVLGIAGPAAPPVLLPHRPPARVPGHLDGELHDVEQVHDQLRVREGPAHR